MSVFTFTVFPNVSPIISYIFLIPALTVFLAGVFRLKKPGMEARKLIAIILVFAVVAAGITSIGFLIQKNAQSPSTITIGKGYVLLQSSVTETGSVNVSSSQISGAYVSQLGTGNLTLHKQHGLNNNVDDIGMFTLGNGATAYVITNYQKVLVVELDSGKYMILGNSNLTDMVSDFSQDVYPVS